MYIAALAASHNQLIRGKRTLLDGGIKHTLHTPFKRMQCVPLRERETRLSYPFAPRLISLGSALWFATNADSGCGNQLIILHTLVRVSYGRLALGCAHTNEA